MVSNFAIRILLLFKNDKFNNPLEKHIKLHCKEKTIGENTRIINKIIKIVYFINRNIR